MSKTYRQSYLTGFRRSARIVQSFIRVNGFTERDAYLNHVAAVWPAIEDEAEREGFMAGTLVAVEEPKVRQ